MLYLSLSLFSGNKKKGIKSSIGRLFGKKDKPQPMNKDDQITPPVIPGWLHGLSERLLLKNLWKLIAFYLTKLDFKLCVL